MINRSIIIFLFAFLFLGCENDALLLLDPCTCEDHDDYGEVEIDNGLKTENVVIVVIDGVRFSESGGDNTRAYCPNIYGPLADNGVVLSNFYNDGHTKTVSGHATLLTGKQDVLSNNGSDFPQCPSILQLWLKETQNPPSSAWIVSAKEKLDVLADCASLSWRTTYNPSMDAGKDGLGMETRSDAKTHERALEIINEHHPNFLVVLYAGPDIHAHEGDWEGYVNGISSSDQYVNELWQLIETDRHYSGKTSLFVTNDHGRHLDGIAEGFVTHGDDCEGCRHLNMVAYGPDFNKGINIQEQYSMVDFAPTVAKLMNINMLHCDGDAIETIFK